MSLRLLLCFLVLTFVAKFTVSILEGTDTSWQGRLEQSITLVNPGFASAANAKTKEQPMGKAEMEPQQCESPEEILLAIDYERDLLNTQKVALDERKASISLAEEKLKQETVRLSDLKKDLEDLLLRVEQAKSDDLKRLVSIYSGMKPKEAATIMNTLDIEVTVMVLGQMKERDAAPIFAKLNIIRSQAISKIILERSKLPGDQKLNGIVLQ